MDEVNESYFRELVQTLMEKAKKLLYQKVLLKRFSCHICSLDEWDLHHNLLTEPLQNVFKLIESQQFEEIDSYVETINFFKDEMQDLDKSSRLQWKTILMYHPLTSTWICNENEPESWLRVPPEDLRIFCHPVE